MMAVLLAATIAAVVLSAHGRLLVRRRDLRAGSPEALATLVRWDLSATAVVVAGGAFVVIAGP